MFGNPREGSEPVALALDGMRQRRLSTLLRVLLAVSAVALVVPLSGLARPGDRELSLGVLTGLCCIVVAYGLALWLHGRGRYRTARTLTFVSWTLFAPSLLLLLEADSPPHVQAALLGLVMMSLLVTQNAMLALAPGPVARPWFAASLVGFTIMMVAAGLAEGLPWLVVAQVWVIFVVLSVAAGWTLQTVLGELEQSIQTSERRLVQAETNRIEAERARLEAEEASGAKSGFLANMSHELRTPLNAIIGYVELVSEELTSADEGTRADLMRIHRSGNHLLGLINGVLDLSRIEAGRVSIRVESVEVPSLLDEVAEALRPLAHERLLELVVDPGAATRIVTDRVKLRQILVNLLGNAIKYTPRGSVVLRGRVDGRITAIDVVDTGVGIAPDDVERIFDDFERTQAPITKQYGGTGLGLALVRRLCDVIGAEVRCHSELGRGSVFTVELPTRGPLDRG